MTASRLAAAGWPLPAAALFVACTAALAQKPEPSSLEKDFQALLDSPGKATYLKVHAALTSHPEYNPYSRDLGQVGELIGQGRYREARAKLDAAMPNLILSPRAHGYGRVVAEKLGDAEEARRRDAVAQKCVEGILSTGEGSPDAPFVVSRVSDEYDVLRQLNKRMSFQSLKHVDDEERGKRAYDVIRCTDQSEVWFDVTTVLEVLQRRLNKENPDEPKP